MIRSYARHVARFSPPARAYLLALLFQSMGQTVVWVLRNLFLKKAGFEESFIGATLSFSSLGAALAILCLAGPMDRRRLKPFIAAASLLISVGLFGVALWPTRVSAVLSSFISGTGLGLSQMCMPLFLVRHSEPYERPYLFGVGQALHPLAGLATTLCIKGGALLWGDTFEAVRNLMFFGGAMPLVAIALISRVREAPPEGAIAARDAEPLDWRLGWKFWSTELMIGLGAGLTIPFINLYFHNRFSVEPGDVGLFYAAAEAIMFVGFLSTPLFASRWGAVRTIVFFQLVSIPFFLAMAFTTSLGIAVAAFLLRQAMMNMVHPVSDYFLMETANPRQRARINGVKQMFRRAAWIVATPASGFVIEHFPIGVDGFTTAMLATIAFYLAGTALYWAFFRRMGTGRAGGPGPTPPDICNPPGP
jgi:MFS family permease